MRSSRARGGTFPDHSGHARRRLINGLAASVLLLSSCSDEPASRAPNKARYCELATEYLEELTASLPKPPTGPDEIIDEEVIDQSHRKFVENFGARFDEIEKVAPPEIYKDVRLYYRTLRKGEFIDTPGATEAEHRLDKYNHRHCGIK